VVDISGPGLGCRYSDRLQAERFGFRTPLGVSYFRFSKLFRPDLGPIQPPVRWEPWLLTGGKSAGAWS